VPINWYPVQARTSPTGYTLHYRLRHEQAVERVFMNRRQTVDRDRVHARDRQFPIAVIEQPPPQQARIHLEIVAPESLFDGDLPQAG